MQKVKYHGIFITDCDTDVGRETRKSQLDITKDVSRDNLDPVKKLESSVFSPTGRIDYVVEFRQLRCQM